MKNIFFLLLSGSCCLHAQNLVQKISLLQGRLQQLNQGLKQLKPQVKLPITEDPRYKELKNIVMLDDLTVVPSQDLRMAWNLIDALRADIKKGQFQELSWPELDVLEGKIIAIIPSIDLMMQSIQPTLERLPQMEPTKLKKELETIIEQIDDIETAIKQGKTRETEIPQELKDFKQTIQERLGTLKPSIKNDPWYEMLKASIDDIKQDKINQNQLIQLRRDMRQLEQRIENNEFQEQNIPSELENLKNEIDQSLQRIEESRREVPEEEAPEQSTILGDERYQRLKNIKLRLDSGVKVPQKVLESSYNIISKLNQEIQNDTFLEKEFPKELIDIRQQIMNKLESLDPKLVPVLQLNIENLDKQALQDILMRIETYKKKRALSNNLKELEKSVQNQIVAEGLD